LSLYINIPLCNSYPGNKISIYESTRMFSIKNAAKLGSNIPRAYATNG
jgi:hypothetical protein